MELKGSNTKKTWVWNTVQSVSLLLLGWVIGKITEDFITDKVLASNTGPFVVIVVILVLLTILVGEMLSSIRSVEQQVGIKVTYFDRDTGEDRGIVFQRAKSVIESAQKSILILNSFISEESVTGDEGMPYYQSLIQKAREGVRYERILQIRENQSVSDVIGKDYAYIRHFHDMLIERERNPRLKARILLRKAKARFLTTFVLVDEVKLLWQVNEFIEDQGMRMRGIFIFDDPRQEITRHFKSFFDRVAADENTESIKRDELPEVGNG